MLAEYYQRLPDWTHPSIRKASPRKETIRGILWLLPAAVCQSGVSIPWAEARDEKLGEAEASGRSELVSPHWAEKALTV